MKTQKGFTLIELVMVIVILGILAIVAVPRFFDLSGQAHNSSEQGVVGGVRAGISTSFANSHSFPATLDSLADGTTCATGSACFADVLDQGGITDGAWAKVDATHYTHTGQGAGSNTSTYTYDPANGSFLCTNTCP